MAKTPLTKKIERALFAWYPNHFAGYRVDKFRKGFGATEVPAENGTVQGGLIDYARVQECFVSERTVGRCKLGHYRESEPDSIKNVVRQFASDEGCPKDLEDFHFRLEQCEIEQCKYHCTRKEWAVDALIVCVEIKVSASDFMSKHGHNFVGNANYYALPAELFPAVESKIPAGIGVLLFYDTDAFYGLRKKRECTYQPLTAEQQKLLICSVAKRNNKVLHQLLNEARRQHPREDVWS